MNKQQIFNKVAEHLLTQGEKAVNNRGYSVFVNHKGQKCALGILMPNITPLYEYTLPPGTIKEIKPDDMPELTGSLFLSELRNIHDRKEPHTWKGELRKFAEEYDLSDEVLDRSSIEDMVNELNLEKELVPA